MAPSLDPRHSALLRVNLLEKSPSIRSRSARMRVGAFIVGIRHGISFPRTHRPQGQRALPRRDDIRARKHRGGEPADARPLCRGRRQFHRHGRRLQPRRLRGDSRALAEGQGPRRVWSSPPRSVSAPISRTRAGPTTSASAASTSWPRWKRACGACRPTTSTSTRSTCGTRTRPGGNAEHPRRSRPPRQGPLPRRQQLQRLAVAEVGRYEPQERL